MKKEEGWKDGMEVEGRRVGIRNFGELLMLIQTETDIYKVSGLEKEIITTKDLLKLPLGEIMDMIKTYKLFR